MIRTQIQLTAEQAVRLKRATSRSSLSMAEVVRRALDSYLDGEPDYGEEAKRRRAALAAGAFKTGDALLATEHDAAFSHAVAGDK